jgi:CubicO group peptidase (beta-lactamase class C family)
MDNSSMVCGNCAPEYLKLRAAFEANFSERGDVGASLAVVVDGELVVDLWGGVRNIHTEAAWEADTLVNVWSTTKGLTAACFAMLVSRGQLSYDTPVSEHWPEFARHGKQDVSVAMLLSHQAGLCGFRTPTTLEQLYDATTAAEHLAAMEPLWIPGEAHGYHALTMGYLANELFRRVDGRSIRQFVADELHLKHGLELYIGLPPEEAQRAAAIVAEPGFASAQPELELTKVQQAAMANPILSPTLPNTDGWRSAEIPSANGFATARALATLYGCMAVWLYGWIWRSRRNLYCAAICPGPGDQPPGVRC